MLVAKNQIFVFIACVAFGGACGVLFTASAFLKFFIKNRWVKAVPDVAAFTVFSALYVWFAYFFNFPSHRAYMTAGALIGLFIYMKSFHFLLAFRAEKLYNIIVKKACGRKTERKERENKDVGNHERRNGSGNRVKRARARRG